MYSTRVVVADSGSEQRVQMWSNARLRYEIGYTANPTDMQTILTFFRARKGRLYGFRFRDWSDYQASHEALVAGSTMQLQKTYTDGVNTEIRAIKKPCNDSSVILYDNGSSTTFTLDYTTGLITPTSFNAGHTYTWSGNFDTPVRFDIDQLVFSQDNVGSRSLQSTPLIEVLI